MKKENSKEKKNKNIYKVIFIIRIILIAVVIYCLIHIALWFTENKKNAEILAEITDSSIIDTTTIQIPVNENVLDEVTTHTLNFDNLFSTNDSTVGWLTVPNTTIDYPVVKAQDNSFYLNHSFDKSQNSAGWVFADYRNKFDNTDKNIIIYGHNRKDSSMFATLSNTQSSEWYNNTDNKYITFITPETTHIYEVFSTYTIKAEEYYLTTVFDDDETFLSFLNTLKSRSIHDFGVSLSAEDQILTLSTCDATGRSRVIVHAKKIL